MRTFELKYAELLNSILTDGQVSETRNGETKSVFGKTIEIDMSHSTAFPVLAGRHIYYEKAFGELAAFLRGPSCVQDFEDFGCNYWDKWADEEGNLSLDYGNAWLENDQLNKVISLLKNDPHNRRILIDAWNPERLDELSLPCCHFLYQWYVRDEQFLDMVWYQRSVDTMVGLPYDFVLAAALNIIIAEAVDLVAGKITFNLGDTHIYAEHYEDARDFIRNRKLSYVYPNYTPVFPEGFDDPSEFTPDMIQLEPYDAPKNNLEVKA